MKSGNLPRSLLAWICAAAICSAQDQQVAIEKPHLPVPIRSYVAPTVSASRLGNSGRLHEMLRAGKLYLTVQDALALAIENNLNLEVDRYGLLLAQSALERSKAGGPVRGVPSASQQVSSVDSGVGVNGSVQSAGLSSGNGGSSGGNTGGAAIQQVGQVTPNLDPVLQNATTFEHLSQPQANQVVSQTTTLVQSVHAYNTILQEGLISGGIVQFRDYEGYLKENAPSDSLNPAVGPHMDLSLQHNLLRGAGVKLNNRFIRIAQINVVGSRETFRSQLLDLTASVLNLYWDLVGANQPLLGFGRRQRRTEGKTKRPGHGAKVFRGHPEGDRRGRHAASPASARQSRGFQPPAGCRGCAIRCAPTGKPAQGRLNPRAGSRDRGCRNRDARPHPGPGHRRFAPFAPIGRHGHGEEARRGCLEVPGPDLRDLAGRN